MRGRRGPRRSLSTRLVIELDLPAPLFPVLGVPPALQDAGFAAGKNDHAPDVRVGRPSIFERDSIALPDEKAHRAGLMALDVPARHHRAGVISNGHLQMLRGRVNEDALT